MPVFTSRQSQNRRPTPREPVPAEFLQWAKISCEAWIGMTPQDRLGWARSFYYLQILGGNAPPPYSEVAITKLVEQTNDCGLLGACPAIAVPLTTVFPQAVMPEAVQPQPGFEMPPMETRPMETREQQPQPTQPPQPTQLPQPPPQALRPSGIVPSYGFPLMVAALVVVGFAAVSYTNKQRRK